MPDFDALGILRSRYIRLRQLQAEKHGLYVPAIDVYASIVDVPMDALRIAVEELKADA